MERMHLGRAALAVLSLGVSVLVSLGPTSGAAAEPRPQARVAEKPPAARRPSPVRAQPVSAPVSPVLQLQEDLARLGYLPVTFDGQSFRYVSPDVPAALAALFRPGVETVLVEGALMTFEADHGLPARAVPDAATWQALSLALARGRSAPHAFTYVYVAKTQPERVVVWSPAGVLTTSLANTGVPGAVTPDGTWPVYLRLTFQVMRGKNLDGTPYADPVHWISYFHGGDAVHGFVRAAYGYPQSLGCVEVPLAAAQRIFGEMQLGTLVTVASGPFGLVPSPPPTPSPVAASLARRAVSARL